MKPDTLVISGASTKVLSFVGIFRALYEKNILKENLEGIKEIHTLSIGTFYALCLLLRFSERVIYECLIKCDFSECLNTDDINLNDITTSLGLISHEKYFNKLMRNILRIKFQKDDITLKELYDYNPIELYVKCVNVSKQCSIHFNYKTHPDMSVTKLLLMTTTLPIFFRPQKYKDEYYVDGGLSGNLPVEKIKSKNVLCIHIKRCMKNIDEEAIPLLGFLQNMCSVSSLSYNKYKKSTINIVIDLSTYDFNIDKNKKNKIIKMGYEQTLKRLNDKNFNYNPKH
tara:strand:+ start:1740 stop:2591 length:852 start_codon:yes stop_codon:yes gene_type:complete